MFKKILVPTDGSKEATAAGREAIELARLHGASVIAFHVAPPFQRDVFEEFMISPQTTRESWQEGMRLVADRCFHGLKEIARASGVPFSTDIAYDKRPADAIAAAVNAHACDLVVMGPRGRSGLAEYMLGSVTLRVLAATTIPVLVHRA
jgi:nucleotide-binding universal stress UspA family protein